MQYGFPPQGPQGPSLQSHPPAPPYENSHYPYPTPYENSHHPYQTPQRYLPHPYGVDHRQITMQPAHAHPAPLQQSMHAAFQVSRQAPMIPNGFPSQHVFQGHAEPTSRGNLQAPPMLSEGFHPGSIQRAQQLPIRPNEPSEPAQQYRPRAYHDPSPSSRMDVEESHYHGTSIPNTYHSPHHSPTPLSRRQRILHSVEFPDGDEDDEVRATFPRMQLKPRPAELELSASQSGSDAASTVLSENTVCAINTKDRGHGASDSEVSISRGHNSSETLSAAGSSASTE